MTDSPWLYGNDRKISDSIWNRLSEEARANSELRPGVLKSAQLNQIPDDKGIMQYHRQPSMSFFSGGPEGFFTRETNTKPYDWYRGLIASPDEQQTPEGGM